MMDSQIEEKIKENNVEIQKLLNSNEQLLKEAGYNPPEKNYALNKSFRVQFPNGYIRTNDKFISKYHLNEIITDYTCRKNTAYALQFTDFQNYLVNRFFVWGSIETELLKFGIINLISVLETIVLECANNICSSANACENIDSCKYHFSNKQRNRLVDSIEKLIELKIVNLSNDKLQKLKTLNDLRNNVHIRLATENEYMGDQFSIDTYNDLVDLLQDISQQIYENGIEWYGCD